MGGRVGVALSCAVLATACTNDFDALGSDDGVAAAIAGSSATTSSSTESAGGGGDAASQLSSSGTASGTGGESTGATGGAGNASGASSSGSGGTGGTGGTPPVISCDEQYSAVNGYVPCPADPGQCGFSLSASGQSSCAAQCELHGGECIDAIDNGDACTVFGTGAAECDDAFWSTVWCVCSQGGGGGPPCPSGMTCQNGACS